MRLTKVLFENPHDDELGKFVRGYCSEFAVALHRLFGYKLGAFVQKLYDSFEEQHYLGPPIHSFCFHPKNKKLGIDARGIHSLEDMKANLVVTEQGPIKRIPTTEEELGDASMDGIIEELVQEAEEHIKNHMDQYKV